MDMFKSKVESGVEDVPLLKDESLDRDAFPLPENSAYAQGLPEYESDAEQARLDEPPPVPDSSYKDVLFAVAFLGNTAALAIVLATGHHEMAAVADSETASFNSVVLWAIAVAGVVSTIASGMYLVFVHVWTHQALWLGIWMNLLCICASIVYSFMNGYMVTGVISLVMLSIFGCWVKAVQSRIRLATEMVQICTSVTQRFWGVYCTTLFFTGLALGYIALCTFTAHSVLQHLSALTEASTSQGCAAVWLLFSMLWGLYTLQYTSHLTTSGVLAAWFFNPNTEQATVSALQRASTTSLGAACFAALVIAILETMEQIAAYARAQLQGSSDKDHSALELVACFVLCCFECLLRVVGDVMKFINRYALSIVAIYGDSFCEGVASLMDILSTSGLDMVINDDLVSGLLLMGALATSLVGAAVGAVWVYTTVGTTSSQVALAAGGSAMVAFLVQSAVLSVLFSSVATLYVCVAVDPVALRINHPACYTRLMDGWTTRWGDGTQAIQHMSHGERKRQ